MRRTAEMCTDDLQQHYRSLNRLTPRKVTNDPKTWPQCDRPLTPAERSFLREKEKHERTREAA